MRITESELRAATRMAKRKNGVTRAEVVAIIESEAVGSGATWRAGQILKRIGAKVSETVGVTQHFKVKK